MPPLIQVARCVGPDGRPMWSAPSAFSLGGGGGGLEFGGSVSHCILVLNSDDAVAHFAGRGAHLSLSLQAALGPHQAGRCMEGGIRVNLPPIGRTTSGKSAAPEDAAGDPPAAASSGAKGGGPKVIGTYVYGESGGFFLGGGIQAGVVAPRDWENAAYYGVPRVQAADILAGEVGLENPWPEVKELHAVLCKAEDAHATWQSSMGSVPNGAAITRLGADAEAGEFEVFVPGRLCLFGEHSDWAGGYRSPEHPEVAPGATLVVGLSHEGLYARARRRKGMLVLRSVLDTGEEVGPEEFPMDCDHLADVAAAGGFWSYAAGVAAKVMRMFAVDGLEVDNYRTTLPVRKGLSSSAAMCVLVARAFSRAYGLGLSVRGEMELAYLGERMTPSHCGRMDQACAYGPRPVLMRHDGDDLSVEELSVGAPLHFVIADLAAAKSTVAIIEALRTAYPVAHSPEQEQVQILLGETNLDITRRAIEYIASGDAARLGQLMGEAQAAFDAAGAAVCPEQLTAPVLHSVLAHPGLRECTWGGKGVGSQGDGTVQFLCKGEAGQKQAAAILRGDLGLTTLTLTIGPAGVTTGAEPGGWLARTRSVVALARAASREKLARMRGDSSDNVPAIATGPPPVLQAGRGRPSEGAGGL